MLASVLIRRLTLCLWIVSITWSSSGFMVVTAAWMGGPGTHHWVGGSGPEFPWELRTVCLPMISPSDGAGSWRWLPPGALPLKMAFLFILKTNLWVWTVPQRNLSEHCDQSLLPFKLSLFLFQVLFFFSKFLL
jgi:hypothetical protein